MGANHRQAATWMASGQGGMLLMDSLPVHGTAETLNVKDAVTDSAASATAMATGLLTSNGAVGVDENGTAVSTILELAQVSDWSVGLVTTTSLVFATPAAFAAHVPDRSERAEIARQMMAHNVDVLLGGGEDDFFATDESGCYEGNGKQPRGTNLIANAIASGYTYVCRPEQLLDLELSEVEKLIGLFDADEIERPLSPNLAEMTEAALAILSRDPDGFFLMVEGGQIDWASHDNDAEDTLQLTLGLDAAVAHAQVFTIERPNILLIVAADHETGGMRVNLDGGGSFNQDGPFAMPDGTTFWVDWTTGSHTDASVPVTAQGPYAEMLAGEYSLTRIYETMFTYFVYRGIELAE
jgi:alkaline phosphatase